MRKNYFAVQKRMLEIMKFFTVGENVLTFLKEADTMKETYPLFFQRIRLSNCKGSERQP